MKQLDSELVRSFQQTREEARALRRASEEVRRRTTELTARARELRLQHQELLSHEVDARVQKDSQTWRGIHALRLEVLEQLKQSLTDLEKVRMIPGRDPELQKLKQDIRETIQSAQTSV